MKRWPVLFISSAAAGGLALLAGFLPNLSSDRRTAATKPNGLPPELAHTRRKTTSCTRGRTADNGKCLDVRATKAPEPLSVPDGKDGFGSWMSSRDWEELSPWAAESLRAQFGERIAETRSQVSLLQLRRLLMRRFPDDWEVKLSDLLARAFPDYAQQVLATFDRIDRYDDWLADSTAELSALQHEELTQTLWEKREELFAEDAADIWAAESESRHLRDLMTVVDKAPDLPLEDRLDLLLASADETAHAGSGPLLANKRRTLGIAFLATESVQSDLEQMSPEERAERLRSLRLAIGFDTAAIQAMADLDARHDQQWNNGLLYMTERANVVENHEGTALEEELRYLRARYFGHDARRIEAEEASGFFRFRRRRIYGRN